MQHPPRLSIVIPTKNEGKYIDRTLAQFTGYLEQYDLEVIVSDAHSTDGTAEIVQRYQAETENRIRLVQNTGKQNIAIGHNFGAAHARGEILFHMELCQFSTNVPSPAGLFLSDDICQV